MNEFILVGVHFMDEMDRSGNSYSSFTINFIDGETRMEAYYYQNYDTYGGNYECVEGFDTSTEGYIEGSRKIFITDEEIERMKDHPEAWKEWQLLQETVKYFKDESYTGGFYNPNRGV